eukprot:scaffold2663_cov256-Pinguiococcus_pyrenoidosus.AAC.20
MLLLFLMWFLFFCFATGRLRRRAWRRTRSLERRNSRSGPWSFQLPQNSSETRSTRPCETPPACFRPCGRSPRSSVLAGTAPCPLPRLRLRRLADLAPPLPRLPRPLPPLLPADPSDAPTARPRCPLASP